MPDEQLTSISRHKIAILIDGDNAQASLLSQMLVEAGKYGLVTLRRIYGDWTTNSMNSWKDILNFHAVQPIQQFRYTIGKNATDSAMIIDAMDILHSGVVDGFCLVSSDSDYTRLATRIRETGVFAMGIGEKKTPKPFVNACDVFVYTENLVTEVKTPQTKSRKTQDKKSYLSRARGLYSKDNIGSGFSLEKISGRTPDSETCKWLETDILFSSVSEYFFYMINHYIIPQT
jgi:uncharacterized LabA/DUF88 family protein